MDVDVRTEAAWSAASGTDRILFRMLGNEDRIDFDAVPRVNLSDIREEPAIEELPEPTFIVLYIVANLTRRCK